MTTISETKHTARRRHKHPCGMCDLPIVPGDMYWKHVGADGRDLFSWTSHIECAEEADYLDLFDYDESMSCGILPQLDGHSVEWLAWYAARKATP
jgi:hypothetical protein